MRNRRRKGVVNYFRRNFYYAKLAHVFIVSSTVVILAVLGKDDLLRTYGGILYGVPDSFFNESTPSNSLEGHVVPLEASR